ncbi:hypothetical protein V8E55_000292 [Tylopilus felleus]
MGHETEDTFTARLENILRIANGLKELTAPSYPSHHSPFRTKHSPVVVDSINLPSPTPLLPSLLEAGASPEFAAAASKIYQLRAEDLRKIIQVSIVTASYKIASELPVVASASSLDLLIGKVVSTATEVYRQRLGQWKEEIIERAKQASKSPAKAAAPGNARTFNHDYVPLLEHFFETNRFPTHADKMFLAKKSNMEYRQIHVWFQNRRNRTKKEGKILRKKPVCERAMKSLDELYERMKGHMVHLDSQTPKPSEQGSSEGTAEIEVTNHNILKDACASSSPPHAFPSSYPPTCYYDPFPCKSGPVCFSKPEWRRVLDRKHPLSLSTSIDDLVERFSYLNVRDGTRSKGSTKLQSHAATVAITVIPSRAPHPSLITRGYSQPANIVQLPPSVSAPVSCPKAFQSPSPTSKPITLVPLSASPKKSQLPEKRKTAPLPPRLPGRTQNVCRDTTPSESSSTSSSSPRLCSTDSESPSSSFSSISSLFTLPDASSIQELPNLFGSLCRSPFDNPLHLRRLGDMIAISPSSIS